MGVLDFLFEGKPPPSVTTYGNSTESIPKWMSDYTQGIISRANSIAGEGYQTYGGPRIADFTQDQNRGFDLTRQNVGSYRPGMDLARSFEEQAGETSAVGAASPYVSRAAQTFPEARAAYMDPYTDDVINRAELDANRFYSESIAPQLNKQFTAAGQYGSSQHEREAMKAARDLSEGLQSTSLAARSRGFETAGSLFNQDASRQGALASTVGNLTAQDAAIKGQAGRDIAALEQARYGLGAADAASIGAIGDQQQQMDQANLDLAYQDFQAQRDYPREQVDWLNALIHGMPYDRTTSSTNKAPLAGAQYGPSTASSILGLISAVKGMGTDDSGDFSWGNIFGSGNSGNNGSWGGWGGSSSGERYPWDERTGGTDWGGGFGWADGGRVNTESLDEMMAHLRAKSRRVEAVPEYEDGE